MVNKRVLDYLAKYKNSYQLDALKKQIIQTGYSEVDFEEAAIALGLKPTPTKKKEPLAKQTPIQQNQNNLQNNIPTKSGAVNNQNIVKQEDTSSNLVLPNLPHSDNSQAIENSNNPTQNSQAVTNPPAVSNDSESRLWIKIGAISGILFFVISILNSVLGSYFSSEVMGLIFSFLTSLFAILFLYGFVIISKNASGKLLLISSWALIIVAFLFVIIRAAAFIFPNALGDFVMSGVSISGIVSGDASKGLSNAVLFFVVIGLAILTIIVLGILFGVGLIKSKENIKFAKITGIFFIIGSATTIIVIGILINLVSIILGIILLFKNS